MRLFAPAKVNLYLDVLDRREDGFHNLATVFQTVDWGDELVLDRATGDTDCLEVEGPFAAGVPTGPENVVRRAVDLLRQELPSDAVPSLTMRLVKNVPHQAGLGGGSADAAAALVGVNRLFRLNLSPEGLESLAARVGSDCPLFIRGGTLEGSGRGEVLIPIERARSFAILIVVPIVAVSTPWAFKALVDGDKGQKSDAIGWRRWLETTASSGVPQTQNTFERAVCAEFPDVRRTLEELRARGAALALLSGSGSACFGLFPAREWAVAAARAPWPVDLRALQVVGPTVNGVKVIDD